MLIVALLVLSQGMFAKETIKFDKDRYGISAGESVTIGYTLPRRAR